MLETKVAQFSELYTIWKSLTDIYCDENDHLIKAKSVKRFLSKSQHLEKHTESIRANVSRYDGKIKIEENGYRSIVKVVDKLISQCVEKGQRIVSKVANINLVREYLKTWTNALHSMNELVKIAVEIMEESSNDMLYPNEPNCQKPKMVELSKRLFDLDVTPFYGDLLGFHLKGDCSHMGRVLSIAMASYSNFFGGTMLQKFQNLKKLTYGFYYATSNEECAKKVVEISRTMQVDFIQSFYNMGELPLVKSVKWLPKVSTSYNMTLCYQPLETPHTNIDMNFKVPIPSSHIDVNFVKARFISNYRTKQMLGSCLCMHGFTCRCKFSLAKDVIIFHVHGGGFISQTPESHLDYLHQWSKKLNVPILSIDYSLAPEAPFPRAAEEVLYCYVWMLNNFEALGTTGKTIILSGDSAGGNLVASLTLKTITNCIRIPDSLVLSYAALLIQFYPSPSRLLTLIDPLLMATFMVKCLNAYKDPNYLNSLPRSLENELEMEYTDNNMFLSPLLAGQNLLKHFPRTLFIETDMDACLDENVQFSSKLIDAGVEVQMEVLIGLPHGFQAFVSFSKDCQQGVDHITNVLGDFISSL